jgi:hypothetical protein
VRRKVANVNSCVSRSGIVHGAANLAK